MKDYSPKLGGVATLILLGGFLLCFLAWSYFIYSYGWIGKREVQSPAAAVTAYYVVPGLLSIVFLMFLRLRSAARVNAALVCVSTGMTMYSAELFLTFLTPIQQRGLTGNLIRTEGQKNEATNLARSFGANFDTRSRLEVVRDLRRQGVQVVPSFFPLEPLEQESDGTMRSNITINGAETVPLGGIADRRTLFCNDSGEYVVYQSDLHGFNNPREIWRFDRADIAAVGDSFTQGACVPANKNFVDLIRRRYPATVNLGMADEGPLSELAAVKEYLPRFQPKIVIWFYFEENDPLDLEKEKKSPLLMSYFANGFFQNLIGRQDEIDRALEEYLTRKEVVATQKPVEQQDTNNELAEGVGNIQTFIKLGKLRERLHLVRKRVALRGTTTPEVQKVDMILFRKVLLEAQAFVGGWGGTLYFVYLPSWERYGNPVLAQDRDSVLEAVDSLNIPIIDLDPTFRAHGDPLALFPFRRFAHYNEDGHRLVADEVLRAISPAAR
jgi:hypothetical protein